VIPTYSAAARPSAAAYCRSYSPFPTRFKILNPAFFASTTDNGFVSFGVLKVEITFRTAFLQRGHFSRASRPIGRCNENFPPQTLQSPSHTSYS
jgi:hypothetical protein